MFLKSREVYGFYIIEVLDLFAAFIALVIYVKYVVG